MLHLWMSDADVDGGPNAVVTSATETRAPEDAA
jgi:hypothetical protein